MIRDSFTLLVAAIFSAQTTDGKVNEVTKELFRLAPDCHRLAGLPYDKVLSIIRPVGLAPTKARNIIATAQQIRDRFGGQVPCTYEELESLPGVGHKTASVLMHQAFGEPGFPVDTHVHRLAMRWGLWRNTQDVKKVESMLKALSPQDDWGKVGLQRIYFGREYCQAKVHAPSKCPICSWTSTTSKYPPLEEEDDDSMERFLKAFVSPGKSSKGIITYSERVAEFSSSSSKSITTALELEATQVRHRNLPVSMTGGKTRKKSRR